MLRAAKLHESHDPKPERAPVQYRLIAFDDTAVLETLEPTPAGCFAHRQLRREPGVRKPPVALQPCEDFCIYPVEIVHCERPPPHFPPFLAECFGKREMDRDFGRVLAGICRYDCAMVDATPAK